MKKMKELRSLSQQELESRLQDMKKQLLKLHVAASTSATSPEAGKIRQLTKSVAQIYTLITERKHQGGIFT